MLEKIPKEIRYFFEDIEEFRPVQKKAINGGIFSKDSNFLIISPTGSGKTLVCEFSLLNEILIKKKKVIYLVPLKALASQTYRDLKQKYWGKFDIKLSIGDVSKEENLKDFDLLITTSEKLDSLIRKNQEVLKNVGNIVIDEIHLLNDESRGPTLEILISLFLSKYKTRIVGLSATIKNSLELSKWLKAVLIEDNFRPTKLEHHILFEDEILRFK